MKEIIRRAKKGSKRRSQLIHFRKRFKSRLNRDISTEEYSSLVNQVKPGGSGKFIRVQSNRVTIWEIIVDNIPYRFTYDKITKVLVTILYKDQDEITHGSQLEELHT